MNRNVGNRDRILRALAAVPLLTCSLMAPLPLGARLLAFGGPAGYMLATAALGRCFYYALTGKSTCPAPRA